MEFLRQVVGLMIEPGPVDDGAMVIEMDHEWVGKW